MRLGILVPEFPGQTHAFFWREIKALRGLGHHVEILSTRHPDHHAKHAFIEAARKQTTYLFPPGMSAAKGVFVRPLGLPRAVNYAHGLKESAFKAKARVAALATCAAHLASFERKFKLDHLHVHSCADAAHVAAMSILFGGCTYSLQLHGDLSVYGKDHRSKMRNALFVSTDARPHAEQLIAQVGLDRAKTCTIPMGVETDVFTPAPLTDSSAPLAGSQRSPDEFHLLTVARLNKCKGHHHGINAVKAALDAGTRVKYSIVGEGVERATLQKQIDDLKLNDHVFLKGTAGEGGVLDVLRSADAFLLPSIGVGEASPVAVMEAMACGVPAICSIIGGTPDMITSGTDGILVPQHNEAGLKQAIIDLATDPDRRRAMGVAAREKAVNSFSNYNTARKLVEAIESRKK